MRSPAHLLGAKRLLCLSCAPLADKLPEAISHLINFVSLSGNPHEALAALQQSLPPTIFQILVQTMARLGEEVGLQMVACGRLSPAVAVKDAVQYCSCGGGGGGGGPLILLDCLVWTVFRFYSACMMCVCVRVNPSACFHSVLFVERRSGSGPRLGLICKLYSLAAVSVNAHRASVIFTVKRDKLFERSK